MRFFTPVFVLSLVSVLISGCLAHRPQGAFFDANGTRIHYTVEGKGEPVILVHGVAANANLNWRQPGIIAALAQDHQVIAMDDRGHGRSGKPHSPNRYGMEMVEDVVRLMDHLGIEKAHVAGYSLGGFIALKLAVTHPDRLRTVMPCGAGWERMTLERLAKLREIAHEIGLQDNYAPLLGEVGVRQKGFGRVKVFAVNSVFRWFNDDRAIAAVMESLPQLDVTEAQLRANGVPCLSIVGDRDPLKRGVDAMTWVMGNHSVLVIPGGDHYTTLWKKAFREGMRSFLKQHEQRER